jgi:hypothetical protein
LALIGASMRSCIRQYLLQDLNKRHQWNLWKTVFASLPERRNICTGQTDLFEVERI